MIMNIQKNLILVLFSSFIFLGCSQDDKALPEFTVVAPKVETITQNNITVEMTASPGQVEFDKDVILTVKIKSTMAVAVDFTLMEDRLEGFEVVGEIVGVPTKNDGWVEQVNQYSLTPQMSSDIYRIAPIAVKYTETAVSPVRTGWFPTKPIVFEPVVRVDVTGDDNVFVDVKPLYVRPTFTTIGLYILIGLGAIAIIAFIGWLISKTREQIKIRKMSPKERAMRELSKLLSKRLVAKNKVKDFYLELTMIVRRYIERSHGVRAPEQTTEEFLEAVARNKMFDSTTVEVLKEFLESADLVKFAGFKPEQDAIDTSVSTAKKYISTDSRENETEGVRNV
jgi:PBP1b-binding outer membrane lipoprotein LpoB